MTNSTNLALGLIAADQAQKHVTANEAFIKLDGIVQLAVLSAALTAPPGSPAEGDRYIVAASPTGAWAGMAAMIATWTTGAWVFYTPKPGWIAWNVATRAALVYSGTAWVAELWSKTSALGTVSQTSGVPTGALIERGSNANGEYVRFADGLQICTKAVAASAGAAATWTFPAAFTAAPVVTGNAVATVLSAVCLDAAPSTTAATFSARDKTDARRADTCHLTAIGRWF